MRNEPADAALWAIRLQHMNPRPASASVVRMDTRLPPDPAEPGRVTPMMEQYLEIKRAHPEHGRR